MMATILHLLSVGGPTAVLWRVRSVVVDALNGVFAGWGFSHIGQELLKRVEPALVNGNTSPAIKLKVADARVGAARLDGLPRPVFLGSLSAPARAVRDLRLPHRVNGQAPTAMTAATKKESSLYELGRTALAQAQDTPSTAISERGSDYSPASECSVIEIGGGATAAFNDSLGLETSATATSTCDQVGLLYRPFRAAITPAQPRGLLVLSWRSREHQPSPEALSGEIAITHRRDCTTLLEKS
jgi:hypothetical protein